MDKEFEEFWATYPKDLCHGARNKGVKSQAKISYLKKIKTSEDHEMLMRNMREQMRQDRKVNKAGGEAYRWPFATTYLNQRRYEAEMDSTQEVLEDIPDKKTHCRCGNPDPRYTIEPSKIVDGRIQYSERSCCDCWRSAQKEHILRQINANNRVGLIYKGPGHEQEAPEDYKARCRDWFRKDGKRIFMEKVIA